jgi:2,4-dienoyl-CoA reductase-like NADH-dependent reductase (Old Yellow Enzyme family)
MLDTEQKTLFSTYDLKCLGLKNRVVMASMTRDVMFI